MKNVQKKCFLKCPACGSSRPTRSFVQGALGKHALQKLTQYFVGKGNGTDGGGVVWERHPMTRKDMECVGKSIARSYNLLNIRLDSDNFDLNIEDALNEVDNAEAKEIALAWVEEAREAANEAAQEERRRIKIFFDRFPEEE